MTAEKEIARIVLMTSLAALALHEEVL